MAGPGILFVVPTPIGNLEDITIRATRVLAEVDLIAAEDTRHTRKLLSHLGITTPLQSYYRGQEAKQGQRLLAELEAGKNIALVSDAGTPAISDPGTRLVRLCHEHGIQVIPLPGPSAVTTLVSGSGLADDGYTFLGFLPSKKGQRRKVLQSHLYDILPFVLYESPRRILATLTDIVDILGDRKICFGRELSKLYEELMVATVSELQKELTARSSVRGEIVMIVDGSKEVEAASPGDIPELLAALRRQGLSMKDAVQKISHDLGEKRSDIYKIGLQVWKD
ncbi:MAG: 16S rRNA (cytidine(1402)-2'-O)-methyltransferase [Thermodesulfobacteriota bacterium]